ncbi:MAG TPA: hypothetical protein VFP84_16125 [Kofleriaceae bacterium]|nr:hypothetical protein [Kofleriaceae bacterium]
MKPQTRCNTRAAPWIASSWIAAAATVASAAPAPGNDAVITPITEQPSRPAKDAARVAAAEKALLQAAAAAKSAPSLQAACRRIPALISAFAELSRVRPPAGFERTFADARAELAMQVDHVQRSLCTDPHPDPPVIEDVAQWLGKRMRTSFGRLQRIGKAPAGSREARARAVLDAQLDALGDEVQLAATFLPGAFVLTPNGVAETREPSLGLLSIADLNPHAEIDSITFDHFTSASIGKLTWFAADLHITVTSHEPENPPSTSSTTVRTIELLDGEATNQVAVASFTRVAAMSRSTDRSAPDATSLGPLTSLLLSPRAIADAIAGNAFIFGSDPDERAVGAGSARALLARWKTLAVTLATPSDIHEMHGGAYGYATANVRVALKPGGPSYDLRAFTLALPAYDGTWSVIAASFGAR